MTGPTTQEYQPLSQALQFQSQQPRLQLAPRELQKPQSQTQRDGHEQRQQQKQQQSRSSASPAEQRPEERATSVSSSREVSPAVGVETSQTATGQKRKSTSSKGASSKKRKMDQTEDEVNDVPVQYGLGTHYSYPYPYPPPPPVPTFHQSPVQPSTASTDMSFNEFQWRLLNLCGEFYEAATELIRSTPHLVLSQAFQVLDRGMGMDPISVLNDARRTCDVLLTNPQALSSAPPPPTALPLATLTSLAHLSSRPSAVPAPVSAISPPAYYPAQSGSMVVESYNPRSKEKERASNNVQGTWKEHEVQKLKALAEKYKIRDNTAVAEEEEEEEEEAPGAEGEGEGVDGESAAKLQKKPRTVEINDVDWDKVVEEFGDERSRHQVLIKATYLGLKPSSTLPGKKLKKKRTVSSATLPPPLTFSSASVKSIPTGYNPPQVGDVQQSPSATPSTPATATHSKPAVPSVAVNVSDSYKSATVPPLPLQLHPHHMHAPYGQTGWYPPPQNPYYSYHQPMYYSPHPQGYGMQGYSMQPPPQGYYPPPYPMPPGIEFPPPEKQMQVKGKRKDTRKEDATTAAARATPVPPPSLPPKVPSAELTTSTKPLPAPVPVPTTGGASKQMDAPASGAPTPQASPPLPPTSTSTGIGSSGVLRRGPNNSLFTYTPLPHGPGNASIEQAKES